MKIHLTAIMVSFLSFTAIAQDQLGNKVKIIRPIAMNMEYFSGIDLKPVTNKNEPDRKLFQRNIFYGKDLSLYVVSSESKMAIQENYPFDEFVFLVNGGARVQAHGNDDMKYRTGDFFAVPKGFKGEWETIGAPEFHHEVSVITTKRTSSEANSTIDHLPYSFDTDILSGLKMTKVGEVNGIESYSDTIFQGQELTIVIKSETGQEKIWDKALTEQIIYVINGIVEITDIENKTYTFHSGSFFVLPKGFTGKWNSRGHSLFRSMHIYKTNK